MIVSEDLKIISFFNGLKSDDLAEVSAKIIEKKYSKDDVVILEGAECQGLYVVKSGRVKVFKTSLEGREHIFYYARQGDSFCESGITDNAVNLLSASASADTVVYFLPKFDLKNLLHTIPDFAMIYLRRYGDRMGHLIRMVEDLSFKNVPERLARILTDIIGQEGAESGGGAVLKRTITLYEVASLVGTVREVVTRSLQKLEKDGILNISRHQIEIIDLKRLKALAGEQVL